MAASLLSCTSLSNNRMKQPCVHLGSTHMKKAIEIFGAGSSKCMCNSKLFMIPREAVACHGKLKAFASVSSLNSGVRCEENHASSCSSVSDDLTRSRILPECPSKPSDGVNDFELELQELFDEVKRMIKMGNKIDALDLLQANYEVVREQMNAGARGIEEAATLDVIALGYLAIGDLKIVVSLLNMLNEVVDSLKDDSPLLDSVLIHMGSMYSVVGKLEKSVLAYQRAIDILESLYGKNSTLLVSPLLGIAKTFSSIGRAQKAVEIYLRAITILECSRGVYSEDLVVPLCHLGNLLIKEGKAADAGNPFARILGIYSKLYGENDGRVAVALCSLAHMKCAIGNAEEAIALYRKALQITRDTNYMALDDGIVEKMRIDLAELLHVVGRGREGRELLEECLLISEKYKGKEHPNTVTHLINLATSYSQSKNFAEAERLLRTGLEIMKKNLSPDDQSITFPMLHLAATLYHLNRDEEAEQLALQVLHIREKAFGNDSLPVGEALDCLVPIQRRLGKADSEILEVLRRVLKIQEKELGNESEEVMETLKKIVFYLDRTGRKDEKFSFQKRLSVLRKKYKQMVHY